MNRKEGEDPGSVASWSQRKECFRKECPMLLNGLQ